jgi:hypothetical protein
MANDVKARDDLKLAAGNLTRGSAPEPGTLSGTWLLVASEREQFRDLFARCTRAMTGCGAQLDVMLVDCTAINPDVLAGLLEGALAGASLAGVLSLLALNQTPLPDRPTVSAGRAGTLGLIQAMAGAGVTAPLWVLTRGPAQTLGLSRVVAPEQPDGWAGLIDLIDVPAEFDERAVGLLCAALAGHRRPARRDELAAIWSTEANRERLQAVDEAAGAPA